MFEVHECGVCGVGMGYCGASRWCENEARGDEAVDESVASCRQANTHLQYIGVPSGVI